MGRDEHTPPLSYLFGRYSIRAELRCSYTHVPHDMRVRIWKTITWIEDRFKNTPPSGAGHWPSSINTTGEPICKRAKQNFVWYFFDIQSPVYQKNVVLDLCFQFQKKYWCTPSKLKNTKTSEEIQLSDRFLSRISDTTSNFSPAQVGDICLQGKLLSTSASQLYTAVSDWDSVLVLSSSSDEGAVPIGGPDRLRLFFKVLQNPKHPVRWKRV